MRLVKLVKLVTLSALVLCTSACSVVGILADTAIQTVSDNHNERRTGQRHRTEIEPFFTKIGLEQDVKLVKGLIAKLPEKKDTAVPQEVNLDQVLACKNVLDGQQQCYPPEYYKDMYIEDSAKEAQKKRKRIDFPKISLK